MPVWIGRPDKALWQCPATFRDEQELYLNQTSGFVHFAAESGNSQSGPDRKFTKSCGNLVWLLRDPGHYLNNLASVLGGGNTIMSPSQIDGRPPTDWKRYHASSGYECLDAIAFSSPHDTPVFEANHRDLVLHGQGAIADLKSSNIAHCQIDILVETRDLINIVLEDGGHCWRYDGKSAAHYITRRGSLAFVPAGYRRLIDVSGPIGSMTISLPKGLLGQLDDRQGNHASEPFGNYENAELATLVHMLAQEISAPGFASDLIIDGLLCAINGSMMRRSTGASPEVIDHIYISPARLAKVMEYIEYSAMRKVTLAELAEIANLSVYHFARVFKRQTGMTPYQAITVKRMDLSRRLLASGEKTIAEVAIECGFSSQASFTTAFGKYMGMTPGRYRYSV
ncbi:AraC-like DNA-binding protein [Erythromicrobium ramosum]|uniref:AraC-like DNA-binding protein n=1 Tax=Erythrobacter ramosus TaxID=35811 RepID=A0A6I4UHZ9_9SPHN|nr:AraC family transcriptional regulator [Erythrobacter ramosus]MBB3775252.1 AraC-like DNA-binding protein [Erythrobacter ramosus]MXP37125.1 helix-turn-helix domain-containing protein [Erythrobacter ramosus]